jgi:hypothetical protein
MAEAGAKRRKIVTGAVAGRAYGPAMSRMSLSEFGEIEAMATARRPATLGP